MITTHEPPPPTDLDAPTPITPLRRPKVQAIDSDPAAEDAVISACLQANTETVENAAATGLTSSHFTSPSHGQIWAAILGVVEQGHQPDVTLVADQLARNRAPGITGADLVALQATPLAYRSNVARYAEIIIRHHLTRAAKAAIVAGSEELRNGAEPRTVITRIADRLPAEHAAANQPIELDAFLDCDEPDHDWIVPGLIERGDRTIITARAGTGKSTLLRQIGVMCASGLHPFTLETIEPVRVLMLDTENSERQVRRHLRPLRKAAGADYQPGMLHVEVYGHSINLADQTTASAICKTVERLKPEIICAGPLYKLAEGDPKDEQVARVVADTFDRIRGINGSGLAIEAHSPYPTPGTKTKPTIRPYGASLWERWPEFGWYLAADGTTEHWRGQREEREWPTQLARSTPWPWMPTEPDHVELEAWDGPTNCIAAIAHYLAAHPTDELSARSLETALRATGNGYRQSTVREAAERAALKGDITVRIGPRNARLYSHSDTTRIDASDPGF